MSQETDLSDQQWAKVEHYLPAPSGKGRPPAHTPREMLDAVLWLGGNDAGLRSLPSTYPKWGTVHAWVWHLNQQGVLDRLQTALQAPEDQITLQSLRNFMNRHLGGKASVRAIQPQKAQMSLLGRKYVVK